MSGEDLDEEIVQFAEVNLFNSSGLLVTSWEAVKAASVGNVAVKCVESILVSGQIDNKHSWSEVHPEFFGVRGDLTVVYGVLLKGDHLFIPLP